MIRILNINSGIRDINLNIEENMILEYTNQSIGGYISIKNNIINGLKLNKYYQKTKEIQSDISEIEYVIDGNTVSDDFVDSSFGKTRVFYKLVDDHEVLEIFYKFK